MGLAVGVLASLVTMTDGAEGAVLVNVTGTPGSGETTWTFSGSATVTNAPIDIDDNDGGVSWGWVVGSPFYTGTNTNLDFTSTSATLSDGTTTYDILGVGAEFTNPDELFGIAIDDATASQGNYGFPAGTNLSFSGFGIAPVDINEFASGTTTTNQWASNLSDLQGNLPVEFTVGDIATTPEPSLLFALIGLSALGFLTKKK
ncbi:MAG: hypothetical protein IGQ45_15100 [Cyanobacterium sp. T60_A2020_053]|nr:hypothetical protein [Cyanobacterium sp. T60_A2020_053]